MHDGHKLEIESKTEVIWKKIGEHFVKQMENHAVNRHLKKNKLQISHIDNTLHKIDVSQVMGSETEDCHVDDVNKTFINSERTQRLTSLDIKYSRR